LSGVFVRFRAPLPDLKPGLTITVQPALPGRSRSIQAFAIADPAAAAVSLTSVQLKGSGGGAEIAKLTARVDVPPQHARQFCELKLVICSACACNPELQDKRCLHRALKLVTPRPVGAQA
jgi:hypothetical protein